MQVTDSTQHHCWWKNAHLKCHRPRISAWNSSVYILYNVLAITTANHYSQGITCLVCSVLGLPHVPAADMLETFEIIKNNNWNFDMEEKKTFLQQFVEYAECVWVKRVFPPKQSVSFQGRLTIRQTTKKLTTKQEMSLKVTLQWRQEWGKGTSQPEIAALVP